MNQAFDKLAINLTFDTIAMNQAFEFDTIAMNEAFNTTHNNWNQAFDTTPFFYMNMYSRNELLLVYTMDIQSHRFGNGSQS